MSLDVVAPDTITSWVASAFALHKQDGLGIAAQTAKVIYPPPPHIFGVMTLIFINSGYFYLDVHLQHIIRISVDKIIYAFYKTDISLPKDL